LSPVEAARQLAALAVETKRTSLDVIGAVAREYVRVSPVSYFGTWLRHARHDMPALLRRVSCPALVLVGERDPVTTDSYIALIARLVPDVRIVRVPGATHALPRADPDGFNDAVIAFIRQVGGSGGR
jgi:pimeloyl-ACP methyl ester carboxylesterase